MAKKRKCNGELDTNIDPITEIEYYHGCTATFVCGLKKGHKGNHEHNVKITWANIEEKRILKERKQNA